MERPIKDIFPATATVLLSDMTFTERQSRKLNEVQKLQDRKPVYVDTYITSIYWYLASQDDSKTVASHGHMDINNVSKHRPTTDLSATLNVNKSLYFNIL